MGINEKPDDVVFFNAIYLCQQKRPLLQHRQEVTTMKSNTFIIDRQVEIEETRDYEFRQIKGGKPLDTIKNTCDEYVVAFLNSAVA